MDKTTKTESKWAGSGADVRRCSCTSTQQDAIHGEGRRVKNRREGGWRCTVCSDAEARK